MSNHKTCTACGRSKPLAEFYRNRRNSDGRGPRCLDCHRERQRVYRESNRDMLNRKRREYVKENPHAVWLGAYSRRARRYGFTPVVEDFTRGDVLNRYGDKCWHCDEGQFEELDHYPVAVAQGGSHSLNNVRPSCMKCNRARSNDAHT